jgi:2-polyprenyl-3-methyl-5-hydroxy-6-metoxy-1,4-benzoquinol methylase
MSKACIVCNKNDHVLLQVEDGLPVVKCRSCGLLYVDIQGEEVVESQAMHWEGVYSDLGANRSDGHASREILFNKFLRSKKGKMLLEGRNRILDIGCGEGYFLELLSRAGVKELHGVDRSENAMQSLRKHNGIKVFTGELGEAHYREDFFDLVTLWDVLEHISDPRHVLAEIRRILKKDGKLYIRVPNAQYLLFKHFVWGRVFRRKKCFIPKVHYYNFSPDNLGRMLTEQGFEHIIIQPGIPEIYGSLARRVIHQALYAMSLLIFMATKRIPFTCFMIEIESLKGIH